MGKRILIGVQSRYIKGILFRILIESGYEIVEAVDFSDFVLKLDVYGGQFLFYILEIPEENPDKAYDQLTQFRQVAKAIPVMALIPKDTSEFVAPAIKIGVEDLLLIPKVREQYKEVIAERLRTILKRFDPVEEEPQIQAIMATKEFDAIKEQLEADLRHAARGKYPLSLLMMRFIGVINEKTDKFIQRLKSTLRETDTVWQFTPNTWLISCPFTEKTSILEVERKVFSAFEAELGQMGHHNRINMFTATYPQDEDNLPDLMGRLFNGIHNSMVINSISAPLNTLTSHELENYRKKILKYRRNF